MDIMIDLETMGTNFDAPIISIGAVAFEDTIFDKIQIDILLEDAVKNGVTDGGTIRFWMQQSDVARASIINGKTPLKSALIQFGAWMDVLSAPSGNISKRVWGNGVAFDIVILRRAYEKLGVTCPWRYKQECCFRTITRLFDVKYGGTGTHHRAVDDATNQAEALIKLFRK
jgi:exodeoxyribonuclease VIII